MATIATAAVLLAGSVTTAAADAGVPVRVVADARRDAGPVATDADPADVVAPVTDDAEPVAPTVEMIGIDDAQVEATTESFAEVAAPDPHAADSSDTETSDGTDADDEPAADEHQTDESATEPDEPADGGGSDEVNLMTTGDGGAVVSFLSQTPALAVVGVSWALGSAPADLQIAWRSETATGWTDWEEVHVELADAPDEDDLSAATRDGAAPIAVVDTAAVEVQLASASGALPDDVTVGVVDPGEASADTSVDAGASGGSAGTSVLGGGVGGGTGLAPVGPAPMDNAPGTARPTIYSRAQWGADESMMTWTPSQGRVQGIDIHHTVNANDYTSAQVPGLLRGIYAYHAQDWGRGWGDIGYNFLVDRFGRIWEGRYGGVTAAPIGAHATGLNSNMSGISLLGNFEITAVPAAAFTAVAKLAAWKLWLHGVSSPHGTITLDAGTFNRISGHRDAKQTTCPGRYMYNRLPEMRNRIASYIGSFADRTLDRDLDGDGYADLLSASGGQATRISTVDQGVWFRAALSGRWSSVRTQDAGDFDRDGDRDVVRLTTSGAIQIVSGTATNRLGSARTLASGKTRLTLVVGGADLTGDGWPDLVARRSDGALLLYPSIGGTRLGSSRVIGSTGWNSMTRLTIAPRYLDGRTALLAAHKNGTLYGYKLSSSGSITDRFVVSSSWGSVRLTTGVGDVTGDGKGDIAGIDSRNRLWLYPGSGYGGVYTSRREPLDVGRGSVTQLMSIGRANGQLSFWAIGDSSNLVVNRFAVTNRAYVDAVPLGVTVSSGDRLVVVGDWTAGITADLVVVRRNGDVMLYRGLKDDRYASPTRIARNFDRWESIVGAGDIRGDGRTGLLTFDRQTGTIWWYPSDDTGFGGKRVQISDGASGMEYLVNAGQWRHVTVPDLLMRGADTKRLFRYDGNGPGLALPPVPFSNGWGQRSSVVGVGDVTYDGRPDLVFVTDAGTVMVYPGNGAGGFQSAFKVGTLPAGRLVT